MHVSWRIYKCTKCSLWSQEGVIHAVWEMFILGVLPSLCFSQELTRCSQDQAAVLFSDIASGISQRAKLVGHCWTALRPTATDIGPMMFCSLGPLPVSCESVQGLRDMENSRYFNLCDTAFSTVYDRFNLTELICTFCLADWLQLSL